jgi:ribosomal protein L21E
MGKRVGGQRRKLRYTLKKERRDRGKLSITAFLTQYKAGDKIILKTEPAYQKGQYFRRFHGKQGTVVSQRGFCYQVKIKDANKEKCIYVHPVHMRRA